MPEKKHYKFSPSGSSRWLKCSMSLVLSEGIESRSSSYAEEGTEAHDFAERALSEGIAVSEICGDDEMSMYVQMFVDFVRDLVEQNDPLEQSVEMEVIHPDIDDFGGTVDFHAVYKEGDDIILHTVDLKFGRGMPVAASGNTQMLCYLALLLPLYQDQGITKCRMTIFQPRTAGEAEDTVDVDLDIVEAMVEQIKTIKSSEPKFEAGDHCRWCPVISTCDHLYEISGLSASDEFDVIKDTPADQADDAMIERWKDLMRLKSTINKMLEVAEENLTQLVRDGREIEGLKIVESLSNRQWDTDDETMIKRLSRKGIGKRVATKVQLLTPTQLQKLVDKAQWENVEGWVTRRTTGYKVVLTDDARPEVIKTKPEDEFDVIQDEQEKMFAWE